MMSKWVLLGLALLARQSAGAPLKWYRVTGEDHVASGATGDTGGMTMRR